MAQRILQRSVIVADVDCRDAAFGRRDKNPAERAVADAPADSHPLPAASVRAGCHPQLSRRALVQPAARSIPRVIQRRCHVVAPTELGLQGLQPAGVRPGAWRDSGDAGERALEIVRAEPDRLAQLGQRHRAIEIRGQVGAGALDHRRGRRPLIAGVAPQAGAKPGRLGVVWRVVERDVLPVWPAGRADRPAVDVSRLHCDDECAVEQWVLIHQRLPASFIVGRDRFDYRSCRVHHHLRSYRRRAEHAPLSERCGQSAGSGSVVAMGSITNGAAAI